LFYSGKQGVFENLRKEIFPLTPSDQQIEVPVKCRRAPKLGGFIFIFQFLLVLHPISANWMLFSIDIAPGLTSHNDIITFT
jgi:hypothetical protein